MENFIDIVREFKAAAALMQVGTEVELRQTFDQLLADGVLRKTLGERAAALVEKNRGSIKTTVARAQDLFGEYKTVLT